MSYKGCGSLHIKWTDLCHYRAHKAKEDDLDKRVYREGSDVRKIEFASHTIGQGAMVVPGDPRYMSNEETDIRGHVAIPLEAKPA